MRWVCIPECSIYKLFQKRRCNICCGIFTCCCSCIATNRTTNVYNISCKFFICLDGNREISVTTTRLNIKTAYLIWHDCFLVIERNNIDRCKLIFVVACGCFQSIVCPFHVFSLKPNPPRRTYIMNMEETQKRRNI